MREGYDNQPSQFLAGSQKSLNISHRDHPEPMSNAKGKKIGEFTKFDKKNEPRSSRQTSVTNVSEK